MPYSDSAEASKYTTGPLRLVSHKLCPYVQRAAIVAVEKQISLERVSIDLGSKPDWFVKLSPTGKVPMLLVGDEALFESSVIAEFLDEITPGSLLPADPLAKARHRSWVEFASGILSDIGTLYSAPDAPAFHEKSIALANRFTRIDHVILGPWFSGDAFGLVDAAFGPVFRYLDLFEEQASVHLIEDLKNVQAWRHHLSRRHSVVVAVQPDYAYDLAEFVKAKKSYLSSLLSELQPSAS